MKTYLCFHIQRYIQMFKKSQQRKYQYQKCPKGGPFFKFSTNNNIFKLLHKYIN